MGNDLKSEYESEYESVSRISTWINFLQVIIQ